MDDFTKRIAIILGGTHDHITLIEILKQKGFHTVLIDYFENPPARQFADEYVRESTLDKEKVLEVARKKNASIVIATCIDQALLTMSYVCEKLALPCHINYEQAVNLTNKAHMKQVMKANQIPTSPFVILREGDDALSSIQNRNFPLVVKPADSNSSKGIRRVDNNSELLTAVADAFTFSRSKKVIVEGFVEGEELSVDVAIKDGQATIVMVTQNIKNSNLPDSFTIVQNSFNKSILEHYKTALTHIATKIASAFELKNGPLLVQLLAKDDVLSVIEFSARIGGGSKHSFIKRITGFDMLRYFVDVITGDDADISVGCDHRFGLMNYLYADSGTIEAFSGFEQLKDEQVITDYFYYKTVGMQITNNISSADRPAGYMVADDSLERINQKIKIADRRLKIYDRTGKDIMQHNVHPALANFI